MCGSRRLDANSTDNTRLSQNLIITKTANSTDDMHLTQNLSLMQRTERTQAGESIKTQRTIRVSRRVDDP